MIRKLLIVIVFFNCLNFSSAGGPDDGEIEVYQEESSEEDYSGLIQANNSDARVTEEAHFDDNLPEKYKSIVKSYETVPPKPVKQSWFNKLLRKIFGKMPMFGFSGISKVFQILIYVGIGILAVYLIRLIFSSGFDWPFGRKKAGDPEQLEDALDVKGNDDLSVAIRKAVSEGNFRLAVRYWYIHLLRFSDRSEIISYHPEKTNSDYVREIANPDYRAKFAELSRIYDFVWYGEIPIAEGEYRHIANRFDNMVNTLSA